MIELARSTWTDVAAHIDAGKTTAFLPFGALEQHGPHLPLSTDTLQCGEIARRLAERTDGILLPPVHYGETWGNSGHPGTISLSPSTVTAIAIDIGRAAAGFGVDAFVIVNGDYGNMNPLVLASRLLQMEHGIPALVIDYPGLVAAGDAVKESPWAAPGLCHADEIETSMILSIDPDLVHPDRYAPSYPEMPGDFGHRPVRLGDIAESGVFGDPRPATAEKGEAIIETVVGNALVLVEAFERAMRG